MFRIFILTVSIGEKEQNKTFYIRRGFIVAKIKIEKLKEFCEKTLLREGLTEKNAGTVTEALVTTDMFGVVSHGTKNLYQYIEKMRAGGIDPKAEPETVAEGPAWALLDGHAAIGMVSACRAMDLAMAKARECGIAYAGVRNSCHFGAAGYYANRAAKAGFMGISMSNADPNMSIPNAAGVVIGNNPFSFSVPLSGGKSLFLDIALSNVAALKVVMAKEKGLSVPDSWLIDSDGRPTTDPGNFPGGAFLRPMAAHKGYGFAVMVEILASVITGAGIMSDVTSWNLDLKSTNKAGHAFIAIDISRMLQMEAFEERMNRVVAELKSAPKAKGADRILVPGELDWEKYEEAEQSGYLVLTDAMVENMKKLSEMTGVPAVLED